MTIFTKWVFLTVFLVGLVFGQGARAADTSFQDITNIGGCHLRIVTTSGAKFKFTKNNIKVFLRIDTATNAEYETPELAYTLIPSSTVGMSPFEDYNKGTMNSEGNCADGDNFNNNLPVDTFNKKSVVLHTPRVIFEVHESGLLFVTAKAEESLEYRHIDALSNSGSLTTKKIPAGVPLQDGQALDRMWISSDTASSRIVGGSLHAVVNKTSNSTNISAINNGATFTKINLPENTTMAHMSFPPRKYDFEKLYGATSRPFVQHVGGPLLKSFLHKRIKGQLSSGATAYSPYMPRSTAEIDEIFNRFSEKRIGVFMISGTVYEGACENDLLNNECLPRADPFYELGDCRGCVPTQPRDIIMPDGSTQRGYKVRTDLIVNIGHALSLPSGSDPSPDTSYSTDLKAFIAAAHARGFKVISYTVSPAIKTWCKDVPLTPIKDCKHIGGDAGISNMDWMNDTVFHWMKELHETSNAGVGEADKGFGYDFDGWYLDSSDAGDFMVDYSFIRQVRQEVGSDGIIYMHDSIDPWARNLNPGASAANLSGLKAVFLRTYADYSLSGEVSGKTSTNPDEYFAQVDTLDQDYYKYFTNGYGMDQAFCGHKLMSIGVSEVQNEDNYRAMGENYYCAQRATYVKALERTSNGGSEVTLAPVVGDKFWNEYFFPAHEELGSTYSSAPPVLENSTDWYKSFIPSSLAYGTTSDSGSFSVSWKTVGVECDFDLNDYTAKEIEKHLVLFKGAKLALVDNLNPDPARWGGATKVAGVTIPAAILGATITDGVGFGTTHTTTFTNVPPAGEYKMLFRCETRDKSLVPQKVFQHIRTDTITIP